jgi:hypothetical protein
MIEGYIPPLLAAFTITDENDSSPPAGPSGGGDRLVVPGRTHSLKSRLRRDGPDARHLHDSFKIVIEVDGSHFNRRVAFSLEPTTHQRCSARIIAPSSGRPRRRTASSGSSMRISTLGPVVAVPGDQHVVHALKIGAGTRIQSALLSVLVLNIVVCHVPLCPGGRKKPRIAKVALLRVDSQDVMGH